MRHLGGRLGSTTGKAGLSDELLPAVIEFMAKLADASRRQSEHLSGGTRLFPLCQGGGQPLITGRQCLKPFAKIDAKSCNVGWRCTSAVAERLFPIIQRFE